MVISQVLKYTFQPSNLENKPYSDLNLPRLKTYIVSCCPNIPKIRKHLYILSRNFWFSEEGVESRERA